MPFAPMVANGVLSIPGSSTNSRADQDLSIDAVAGWYGLC